MFEEAKQDETFSNNGAASSETKLCIDFIPKNNINNNNKRTQFDGRLIFNAIFNVIF